MNHVSAVSRQTAAPHGLHGLPFGTTLLFGASCGALAANLYYAQPIAGIIGPAIGLRPEFYGLIVTLTQIGYVIGLLFVVPLGDMLDSRRAISATVAATAAALALAAVAPNAAIFLLASLLIGIFACGTQMLVPLAAHLAHESIRGRTVGNVMSGLLLGILLARPVASLVTEAVGWRGLFATAAIAVLALALLLLRNLPHRRPADPPGYRELIASMWRVFRDTPILRRRILYQAPLFAAFSLFWTAVPLELAGPAFGLSQTGIALFALAGAAGALAAPLGGRAADRGWSRGATGAAFVSAALAFGLCWLGGRGSLLALVAGGIVLDAAVQGNQVLGQRAIYVLAPEIRSRLNGLIIAAIFLAAACGSAAASLVFAWGGWSAVAALGMACAAVPFIAWLFE